MWTRATAKVNMTLQQGREELLAIALAEMDVRILGMREQLKTKLWVTHSLEWFTQAAPNKA